MFSNIVGATLIVLCFITTAHSIVPIKDFYPFGAEHGDVSLQRCDDSSSGTEGISLGEKGFPFFGGKRNKIWVNTNGILSTDNQMIDYTTKQFGTQVNNYQLIAPFWVDVDITLHGSIFYRGTTNLDILARLSTEVQHYFNHIYALSKFEASFAFIATWFQVPRYQCGGNGRCNTGRPCSSPDKRNSFQCILATDGDNSVALYFYENITWSAWDLAATSNNYAEVGFDAGDQKHYFAVAGSRSSDIQNINTRSNVGIPGKWAFKINTVNVTEPSTSTTVTTTQPITTTQSTTTNQPSTTTTTTQLSTTTTQPSTTTQPITTQSTTTQATSTHSTATTTQQTRTTQSSTTQLLDQQMCEQLDYGSGWARRTKVIWNSCLITSRDWATWSQAIQSCNQFSHGHLVILDTHKKENEFRSVLKEWDINNYLPFWVMKGVTQYEQPIFDYIHGTFEGGDAAYAYICQYHIYSLPMSTISPTSTTSTATPTTTTIPTAPTTPTTTTNPTASTPTTTAPTTPTTTTTTPTAPTPTTTAPTTPSTTTTTSTTIPTTTTPATTPTTTTTTTPTTTRTTTPTTTTSTTTPTTTTSTTTATTTTSTTAPTTTTTTPTTTMTTTPTTTTSTTTPTTTTSTTTPTTTTSTTTPTTTVTTTSPASCSKSIQIIAFEATEATITYTQEEGQRVKNGGTAEIKCQSDELIGQFTCIDGHWEEKCSGPTCWSYFSDVTNGYYKGFENTPLPSDSAKTMCSSKCSQLMTVHSSNERNHAVNLISDHQKAHSIWIGMTSSGGKGADTTLKWIDGTPVGYEGKRNAWYLNGKREPNCDECQADCSCVQCTEIILLTDGHFLHWNDLSCTIHSRTPMCVFYVQF